MSCALASMWHTTLVNGTESIVSSETIAMFFDQLGYMELKDSCDKVFHVCSEIVHKHHYDVCSIRAESVPLPSKSVLSIVLMFPLVPLFC